MNVSQCCNCPHSGMPRGRCLCLCHRTIEARRCQRCGYLRVQCHCAIGTDDPIADFAAALNPPAGALADSLPFTLTAERITPAPREAQIPLFDDGDDQ